MKKVPEVTMNPRVCGTSGPLQGTSSPSARWEGPIPFCHPHPADHSLL